MWIDHSGPGQPWIAGARAQPNKLLNRKGSSIKHRRAYSNEIFFLHMTQDDSPFAVALMQRLESGTHVAEIAELATAMWEAIGIALSPIIGVRGVAALYQRSLFLSGSAYPWLQGLLESNAESMDLAALKLVLTERRFSAEAAAGAGAHLQAFHEVLTSLIGSSLLERLFRSVWPTFFGSKSAQDASQ